MFDENHTPEERSMMQKIYDFMMGRKELEKAAGTAKKPPAPSTDTSALQKEVERYMKEKAAAPKDVPKALVVPSKKTAKKKY